MTEIIRVNDDWKRKLEESKDDNWAVHMNDVVSTKKEEIFGSQSIFSPQWNIEKFKQAPNILHDTFEVQEDGSFLVKFPKESNVMQGHLKGLPITPGIVMKKLFLYMTNNQGKDIVNCQFMDPVFPWQTIRIKDDGIYNATNKKVVDVSFSTNEEMSSPQNRETTYYTMKEVKDEYLLQSGKFRFMDEGHKERAIEKGVLFKWEYTFPKDFTRHENWFIPHEILEEAAAQIASYVTGPDLNKETKLWNIEEGTINLNAKVFTFKSGIEQRNWGKVRIGETIYIHWEVMQLEKREAKFCYIIKNQWGEKITNGEITWSIVQIWIIQRAYLGACKTE